MGIIVSGYRSGVTVRMGSTSCKSSPLIKGHNYLNLETFHEVVGGTELQIL